MSRSEQETKPLPGCVGIYTDPEGRVIASVSDFERQGFGGFTLYRSQEIRCKRMLAHAVIAAYCSNVIASALDAYDSERLVEKLKGKMTFVPVGHDDGQA
jgi:hypothetical protein